MACSSSLRARLLTLPPSSRTQSPIRTFPKRLPCLLQLRCTPSSDFHAVSAALNAPIATDSNASPPPPPISEQPRPIRRLSVDEAKDLLREAEEAASTSEREAKLCQLTTAHPDNIHFLLAHAKASARAGRHEEAAQRYQRALDQGSSGADRSFVLVGWATYEMYSGSKDRAAEMLQQAEEAEPGLVGPAHAMGRLAEARGDFEQAESLYRESLRRDAASGVAAQSLAVLLARKGRYKEAIKQFKVVAEAHPTDVAVWQAWALVEWRRGHYSTARDLFEKAMETCPPHSPLLAAYAKMEAQRRNRTKARKLLRQAVAADPTNLHAFVSWAQLEGRAENFAAALEICRQALALDSGNVRVLCTEGQVHYAAGDFAASAACFEEALQRDPGCAVAARELAMAAQREGDLERAEELFTLGAASRNDHKRSLMCAAALAEIREFRGDRSGARAIFGEAEARGLPDGRFLRDWAALEKRLGDLCAAAALYERAAALEPHDERTWLQWGLLERRRGETAKALSCWRKGINVSPFNPHLWQLCATTLWDDGRQMEGREMFRQGLTRCPTNQPLLLEWALREAEAGDAEAGLKIARLAGEVPGPPHAPLLAVWLQLATRLGLREEAAKVEAELNAASSSGGRGPIKKKKLGKRRRMNTQRNNSSSSSSGNQREP